MAQRTVLKIDLSCSKCKKKLLKAVSAVEGVDKIEVDGAKGTLNVTGNADPYDIIVTARKAADRCVDVVSVGPPPPPPKPADAQKKQDEKKGDDQKKKGDDKKKCEATPMVYDPYPCRDYGQRVVLVQMDQGSYNEPYPPCSIM